ncbi:hypothetical protein A9Q99_00730 [Gammaproteobacteria bacterium 45_16_T64]|nr:hypothetical protein A9Q99_00730 [Gammaproteobacteria bacterium 45_16_T64]
MQGFRDLLKGWFGKVLLTIFILPFAFFGIQGLFQANARNDVSIVVDGDEITNSVIDRTIEQQRQNLVQRMGGNIDPSFLSADLLRPGVEDSLIQKSLLKSAVVNEGMYLPQEKVSAFIREMPMFLDEVSGKYSQEKLERVLVQAGYSGQMFVNEITQSLLIEQLQKGVAGSAFVTADELKSIVMLDGQKRDVATLTISAKTYEESVELAEGELLAYYTSHSEQYKSQEKVKVDFVNLTIDDFKNDDVVITEEEIVDRFDSESEALRKKERRRASHILVEINDDQSEEEALEKIKSAKAKLDSGVDFDQVAQEMSEDIATARSGGDLGFGAKGIYDPSFDDALFALDKGEVTDIVRTEFGYHIVKLVEVETPDLPLIDAERGRLVAELKSEKAEEELAIALDEVSRLAFESGDLSVISEQFGIDIQSSDWFTRNGGVGIFADKSLSDAAFSEVVLEDQKNSEAIETSSNGVVVLRVAEHEKAKTLSLEGVRSRVVAALKKQKSAEKAEADAAAVVAAVESGASTNDIESQYSTKWQVSDAVARQNSTLDRGVVNKIFELPKPVEDKKTVASVRLANGDWVVVLLTGVKEGGYTLSDKEGEQMGNIVAGRFGKTDFEGYLATLKDSASITRQ